MELSEKGKQKVLNINISKTEIICMKDKDMEVKRDGEDIRKVAEVVYLEKSISTESRTSKEIGRRILL